MDLRSLERELDGRFQAGYRRGWLVGVLSGVAATLAGGGLVFFFWGWGG